MSRSRVRLLTLMPAMLALGACVTWEPVPIPPARYIEEEAPAQVRLYRGGSDFVELRNPTVVAEQVVGEPPGTRGQVERVRIADISLLRVRHRSIGRTVITLGALAFVATLIAVSQAYGT
jgi:hypothetical protein